MAGTPATIGQYRIVRQIGAGRHGRTFEATRTTGERVALREIECADLRTADRVNSDPSLQRLATIIAGLNYDALADTVEVFVIGKCVYLAEEYLEAPPLDETLAERGTLPMEAAWTIISRVLSGLEFGHTRGVLHLDVRPGNIYCDPETWLPKLTDFGQMQLMLELWPEQSLASIADEYHAPEVRAGQAPTPASEVYSVGAILHRILTGRMPSAPDGAASPHGRFDFLEVGAPDSDTRGTDEILDELRVKWPGVVEVMMRALSPRPEDRYERAALMQRDLRRAHSADLLARGRATRPATVVEKPKARSVRVDGGVEFCRECGRPLPPGSRVCLACGASRTVEDREPQAPVDRDSDSAGTYFQKHGDRLMAEGKHTEAERAYRMGTKREPEDPRIWRSLGDALTVNRKLAEAELAYRQSLRLAPGDQNTRHELARVLLSQNSSAEAITELHKLLDARPSEAMRLSALTQLGAAYASMGQHRAARKAWDEVLAAAPDNARVHFAMATSFLADQDDTRAEEHLRQAVDADPNYGEARRALRDVEQQRRRPTGVFETGATRQVGPSREAAMIFEALSHMGAMLGREQWGGQAAYSSLEWTREDGRRRNGRRVNIIEELDPLAEDDLKQ
jgi:tetratricopeptide (TPR) repeat protein